MTQPSSQILINQLSYSTNDKPIFSSLSLALGAEKTGLIGRNGIGKSTLFKLMTGELLPDSGSIQITDSIGYCPQQTVSNVGTTIAEFLEIQQKLSALARIQHGSINEEDFQIIGDDWLIEEQVRQQLAAFNLAHLKFDQALCTLSGGEQTRLYLAKVFLADPSFMLLDEPTNNLDAKSRQFLYKAIMDWKKGLIVISHDRVLLNLMDQIIELTSVNLNIYGGNYDHYQEQKSIMKNAAERELLDAKKSMNKTKRSIQSSRERLEQKQSYGRNQFNTGKVDKMTADSEQWRSEKTQSRLLTQNEMLLKNAEHQLTAAKSKIEITQEIHIALPKTLVPNGKIIVSIDNLRFSYPNSLPILDKFNLQIVGPERIALVGNNGSGKTTLIKLILGKLQADQGKIYIGTNRISYLDQNTNTLDPALSIIDNFLRLNPDVKLTDAHAALAKFLFRNAAARKFVRDLSGGEKIRAELVCALMSKNPPQLLILDEPTNHLDLESIENMESALKNYQGAMIVISHDPSFLLNIGVKKSICAPFNENDSP